jgi:hypothetical protein
VKRCSGEDTLGVAPRENSSVPGPLSHNSLPSLLIGGFLLLGIIINNLMGLQAS